MEPKIVRIRLKCFLLVVGLIVFLSVVVPAIYILFWPLFPEHERKEFRITFGTPADSISKRLPTPGNRA